MDLNYELTTIGTQDSIQTHRCTLFDKAHKELVVGNGKGLGQQSLASAVFEALEHLFVTFPPQSGIREIPVRDIFEREELRQDPAGQIIKRWNPSTKLSCRLYKPLHDGGEIYYPLFLSAPGRGFPSIPMNALAPATKYSSNNGTAIGLGTTEALIHGISEVVERDALSCFLLQTFVAKRPKPIRLIARDRLPFELADLLREAEKIIGQNIRLLDITTDLLIPAILASSTTDRGVPFVGSGASLSKSYAVERSLLELVQSFHLHTDTLRREDESFLRRFANLPRYQDCLRLDLTHCSLASIRYDDMVGSYDCPENLEAYLRQLTQQVELHGYSVFFHHVYSSALGVDCVHCIVPGLEKFHLVRYGQPVLPSIRGWAKMDASIVT